MKIDLNEYEIWNLLKEGSTNQRKFIESLNYTEFEEFINFIEDYDDFDLRDLLNGGCLSVEETDQINEDHTIYSNGRININLYWK